MDLRSGQRVQTQQRQEPVATPAHEPVRSSGRGARSKSGLFGNRKLIGAVLATLLLLLGIGAALWFTGGGALGAVKRNQYQAVFLTNGQVYFGKIKGISGDVVTLGDIYYLQQQSNVQNQDSETKTPQNQLSLAKLGNELHGPDDTMYIERSQVLFWENIKDESEVVKTIQQEKQQGNE